MLTEGAVLQKASHTLEHHERVAPTKSNSGTVEYWSCNVCGKLFRDEDGAIETSATDLVLPVIGSSDPDDPPAHSQHIYGDWTVSVQPTCTDAGFKEKVCTVCGEKVTESIPALGHTWDSGKVTTAATYDKAGVRTYTCKTCGSTQSEAIAKLARTSLSNASINAIASRAYTGKAQMPEPTVKVNGTTLKKDTDFTVTWSKNVDVGIAAITVTGKGAYTGSKLATFKITKVENKVVAKKTGVKKSYKVKSLKKKGATVALPKTTAKFGKSTWKVKIKDKKKVLSLSKGKVKIQKGAKKGVYTIKLVAKVAKNKNYNAASSKVVTVKVTVK